MSRKCATLDLPLTARFALKRIRRTQVRKGMVLIGKTETPPKGVHDLPTAEYS